MAITRKPKKAEVHKLIAKGGAAGKSSAPEIPVKLRLPEPMLRRVDAVVADRQQQTGIKTGLRHAWILEAIREKVDRESR